MEPAQTAHQDECGSGEEHISGRGEQRRKDESQPPCPCQSSERVLITGGSASEGAYVGEEHRARVSPWR